MHSRNFITVHAAKQRLSLSSRISWKGREWSYHNGNSILILPEYFLPKKLLNRTEQLLVKIIRRAFCINSCCAYDLAELCKRSFGGITAVYGVTQPCDWGKTALPISTKTMTVLCVK
jgi:hypothetical protein